MDGRMDGGHDIIRPVFNGRIKKNDKSLKGMENDKEAQFSHIYMNVIVVLLFNVHGKQLNSQDRMVS